MSHKHTAKDALGITEENERAATVAGQNDVGQVDFQIKQGDAAAYGRRTSDGFVVFKDSRVKTKIAKTCPKNAVRQRELNAANISSDGVLQEDILLNSPSEAACFVTGNATSGNAAWKTADGRTLKKVEGIETRKRTPKPEQSPAPEIESGEPEPEIEGAIEFGGELCSLTVERTKIDGSPKYRLHVEDYSAGEMLDEPENNVDYRTEWASDLEQALASLRGQWWAMHLSRIAPDLIEKLRDIIKTSPAVKSFLESHPDNMQYIERLEEALGREERRSIEEIRRVRASDPVPARVLWSEADDELGMTWADRTAVIDARHEDWDYNGMDGYEPPAAKAILDKYARPPLGKIEKMKMQIGKLKAAGEAVKKTGMAASRLFGRGGGKG